jgi:exodeoxyribonuclease V gamma subunit
LALSVSAIAKRPEKWLADWAIHLAANLAFPLTTILLGKEGTPVTLPPLPVDEAAFHFDTLQAAWQAYADTPPPLAVATGFAWLNDPQSAATVYDGGYQSGERARDAYLACAFADYAALTADGRFFTLAETLLAPLLKATQ